MNQTVRFQEILRRLAIIDEGFVEDQAGIGLGLPGSELLDPKAAALVRVGALVAILRSCDGSISGRRLGGRLPI